MYYPCSENKGADQLRGYREADLRLCFRLGKNPVFSRCGSFGINDFDVKIERAHRLPGKSHPRLLVVKFSYYKDKARILKRYRDIRDERTRTDDGRTDDADQPTTVRISEDFPERVRNVRGLLNKFLNQALKVGKEAYTRVVPKVPLHSLFCLTTLVVTNCYLLVLWGQIFILLRVFVKMQ